MNTNLKTQFWGKSMELKPLGNLHVVLKSNGHHFLIERPTSSAQNIVFGETYVEHYGNSTIKNVNNGDNCTIEFKKRGWGGKNSHAFEGFVKNGKGLKKLKCTGRWIDEFRINNLETN